jgi:cyclic pyranopterin phosphate synthase
VLPSPIPDLEQPTTGPLIDRFGRVHTYLRVSVTDRCNFRCTYCMPARGLDWMPRAQVLSYEEVVRLVGIFASMGVTRIRLTGGEPTLRRGIVDLVSMIAGIEGISDLSMTTNGHALAKRAGALRDAGLKRVNVSLDSLDPDVFSELTRGADVKRVLDGIDAALEAGMTPVKINAVVVRGVNDDHLLEMVDYFAARPNTQLRFIEFMPFDGNGGIKQHVPAAEIRERLATRFTLHPAEDAGPRGGPSRDWRIRENGLVVGFISPITEHFCDACNRLRLQADGSLRTCLSRDKAPNLRDLLRGGASDADLEQAIRAQVFGKVAGHEAHHDGDFRVFEGVMTQVGG